MWIGKLLQKVLSHDELKRKENFIVNCSREALASLAIKCMADYKEFNQQFEQAKKTLLMNSTGDFELLMESPLMDHFDFEFIRNVIDEKYKRQFSKCPMLIVTTYSQNVETTIDNLLSINARTKVLRIC